jgi:two-component system sensor kinase FixL
MSRGETEKRIESLDKMIEETSALALVAVGEQPVRISLQLSPSCDETVADKVQIQQVREMLWRACRAPCGRK